MKPTTRTCKRCCGRSAPTPPGEQPEGWVILAIHMRTRHLAVDLCDHCRPALQDFLLPPKRAT